MISEKFKQSVAWFNQNRDQLSHDYKNLWVVVDQNHVAGTADSLLSAIDKAQDLHLTLGDYVVQQAIPENEEELVRFISNRVRFTSVGATP